MPELHKRVPDLLCSLYESRRLGRPMWTLPSHCLTPARACRDSERLYEYVSAFSKSHKLAITSAVEIELMSGCQGVTGSPSANDANQRCQVSKSTKGWKRSAKVSGFFSLLAQSSLRVCVGPVTAARQATSALFVVSMFEQTQER